MTPAHGLEGTGILLMGYGSPAGPEELPGYLREVLGGRDPPEEMVAEYRRRYDLIGGSPQLRILRSLREKLEARLAREGLELPVFLGTRHGAPHVSEAIPDASRQGIRRRIALPLSPYASPWILAP